MLSSRTTPVVQLSLGDGRGSPAAGQGARFATTKRHGCCRCRSCCRGSGPDRYSNTPAMVAVSAVWCRHRGHVCALQDASGQEVRLTGMSFAFAVSMRVTSLQPAHPITTGTLLLDAVIRGYISSPPLSYRRHNSHPEIPLTSPPTLHPSGPSCLPLHRRYAAIVGRRHADRLGHRPHTHNVCDAPFPTPSPSPSPPFPCPPPRPSRW